MRSIYRRYFLLKKNKFLLPLSLLLLAGLLLIWEGRISPAQKPVLYPGSSGEYVSAERMSRGVMGNCPPAVAQGVARGAATDRGDITLLAQVIEGEAANEPYLGKVAVGAVIVNRTRSASFPHTISGVIFQDYAFESISNGQAWRPLTQESIQAAEQAMSGYDPTGGALFFWNPYKPVSPWIWSRQIVTQIGNHVFAL